MEKVKLSKEEIKKMMDDGTLVPVDKKDLNKRPGFIDRNAVQISVLTFVGIVVISFLIVEFVLDVRSVKPLPELPPDVEMLTRENISEEAILKVSDLWNNKEYDALNEHLRQLSNLYDLTEETEQALGIYRVRLLYYAGQYERAFNLSQVVQSRFVGERYLQLELTWIKGHIYYEQEELLKSMETFRQLASTSNPWREQSAVYVSELRELTDHQNLLEFFIE